MEQYNITGMSCAACSARVEKAVNAVEGVESCAVSLLTNSMGVEGTASPEAVMKAVAAAGYGASLKNAARRETAAPDLTDTETPRLLRRLVVSLVFLLILMYVTMGHTMLHLPLPALLSANPAALGLTQLLLTTAVMVINQRFQGAAQPRTEYGYARVARRIRLIYLEHLRPVRDAVCRKYPRRTVSTHASASALF